MQPIEMMFQTNSMSMTFVNNFLDNGIFVCFNMHLYLRDALASSSLTKIAFIVCIVSLKSCRENNW